MQPACFMPVLISFLRGINVGGHSILKMEALRALYRSLNLSEPQTYVQSGNVIFQSDHRNLKALRAIIQSAIQKKFGCCPEVILRTRAELREVVTNNPFAGRRNIDPSKLLVSFLASRPPEDAARNLRTIVAGPEELHLIGRELYIYFPDGAGKSKLPWSRLDKFLQTPGTARNWNSVTKILELADRYPD